MSGRLGNWSARHGHALVSTLGHLGRHGLATVLTVLALSLALALPLGLQVLIDNLQGVGGNLSQSLGLSVYLKPQLPDQGVQVAIEAARRLPGVAGITRISAAQGLAMLRAQSGLGDALGSLTDNPLPDVLQVRPRPDATSPRQLEQLRAALARLPQVDAVQLDRDWALRFEAIVAVIRVLLSIVVALLAAGTVAVIGNTVRLEVQARAAEIEVAKLVGGSNAFVRRPFLYGGTCYGLIAAALAWVLVALARLALAPPVEHLAATYGSHFALRGPAPREIGVLLGAGAALGWLGAAIAAGRQLSRMQPR